MESHICKTSKFFGFTFFSKKVKKIPIYFFDSPKILAINKFVSSRRFICASIFLLFSFSIPVGAVTINMPAFSKVNRRTTSYLLNLYEKSFSFGLVDKTLTNLMFIAPKKLSAKEAVRFHMLLGLVYIESGGFLGEQEITILEKLKADKNVLNMMRGAAACKNKAYKDAMFFLEQVDILTMQNFASYIQYKKGMCFPNDKTRSAAYLVKALSPKNVFAPVYLEVAKILFAERKYRETVKVLRKYISFIPNNFEVITLLGKLYLQDKQPHEAAVFFAKARVLRPMDAKAALSLLNTLLVGRDFEGLVLSGKEVISDMPFLRDAFYLVFEGYVGLGKIEDAILLLEKLTIHESYSPLLLGLAYLALDDIKSSEKFLTSTGAGELFPIAKAVLMLKIGKFHEGKAVLINFLQKKNIKNNLRQNNRLKKSAMFFLGLLEASLGNYDIAVENLKKADSFLPNFNVKALSLRHYFEDMSKEDLASMGVGCLFLLKGWESLHYFERLEVDNMFSCFFIGSIYLKKRDFDNAKKYFLLSNSLERKFIGSTNSLGKIFSTQRRYRDAILWYKKSLALEPTNSNVLFNIGLLYDLLGDYDESMKFYTKLLEVKPNSYIAYNQIAWNLGIRKNKLKKALEYALKGIELKADNGNLLDTTGWIYFLLGKYKKAHEFLLLVRNTSVQSPSYYYHLAAVKAKLGKSKSAYKILKNISNKAFPEQEDAKELLQHLEDSFGATKPVK